MKFLLAFALFVPFVVNSAISCDDACTFVVKKANNKGIEVSNSPRADKRYSPFSTFKVPNSLIALEVGLVKSPEQKLTFDETRYPRENWWRKSWYESPLTLKEAFAVSAVPIYRQIAYEVGQQKMTKFVNEFDYGNKDISSGIDSFWLSGSIRISAKEQIAFLQKLNEGTLPVSKEALDAFKDVMRVEQTEQYSLYAKTGAGRINAEKVLGWYVGIVENAEGAHYFAFNIEDDNYRAMGEKRIKMARQFLEQAGVL